MKFLQRPYYLGLLNVARYHGAAHQQPQKFFVVTDFPVLRATQNKGMRINYISTNKISVSLIEQKKTEAGYLNISSPALTATDLIQYEKRIEGINRSAQVINNLAKSWSSPVIKNAQPITFITLYLSSQPRYSEDIDLVSIRT